MTKHKHICMAEGEMTFNLEKLSETDRANVGYVISKLQQKEEVPPLNVFLSMNVTTFTSLVDAEGMRITLTFVSDQIELDPTRD